MMLKTRRAVSKKGIDFLIAEEGNIPYAYYCQANVKTIGIGMVIKYLSKKQLALLEKVQFNEVKQFGQILPAVESDNTVYTISKPSCEKILKEKLITFENAVSSSIKVSITQNQFDALVSFTFNVGIARFKKSTLLKKVNIKADDKTITKWFSVYNKAKGKVLPVLTNRRKREVKLFFS